MHFHDLRHTGNMLAAESGATMRELMDRMGHDSARAAMIYLHGSDARQQEIADSLDVLLRKHVEDARSLGQRIRNYERSGTDLARPDEHE